MEAKEVYDIAIKFSKNVDYRTRIKMPEVWQDWFINETDGIATDEEYLVFCVLTMHFLKQDRDFNIEYAFIMAYETNALRSKAGKPP